jgi:hypothetical protein
MHGHMNIKFASTCNSLLLHYRESHRVARRIPCVCRGQQRWWSNSGKERIILAWEHTQRRISQSCLCCAFYKRICVLNAKFRLCISVYANMRNVPLQDFLKSLHPHYLIKKFRATFKTGKLILVLNRAIRWSLTSAPYIRSVPFYFHFNITLPLTPRSSN